MDEITIDRQQFEELNKKVDKIYQFIKRFEDQAPPSEDEPWLDTFELCNILHISPKTLYRYRKKNLIPHTLLGDKPRYFPSQIYRVLKNKIIKCDPKYINDFYQNYINDAK